MAQYVSHKYYSIIAPKFASLFKKWMILEAVG